MARTTALILDGGGVRGLSSLLILKRLVAQINTVLPSYGYELDTLLTPQDIFQYMAGTSTGGLIAMMLARLHLSTEVCIEEYKNLSEIIFKKKKLRGKFTGGLWTSRYRGTVLYNTVRELLARHGELPDEPLIYPMSDDNESYTHCAVVCREEIQEPGQASRLADKPMVLCSVDCGDTLQCRICEAARATSAAMSYFNPINISGRYFSDGGLAYNNPSAKIYEHCTKPREVLMARNYNVEAANRLSLDIPSVPTHANIDFSICRMINIGTGDYIEGTTPRRKRDKALFFPQLRRRAAFYKESLVGHATSFKQAAKDMRLRVRFGETADGFKTLVYVRLSVDNELCWIKLDRYQDLGKIESLTNEWLDREETQQYINNLAREMAKEYMQAHPPPMETTTGENRAALQVDTASVGVLAAPGSTASDPPDLVEPNVTSPDSVDPESVPSASIHSPSQVPSTLKDFDLNGDIAPSERYEAHHPLHPANPAVRIDHSDGYLPIELPQRARSR